jgi:uncharacterized protein YjbI with pentapeptide repeats
MDKEESKSNVCTFDRNELVNLLRQRGVDENIIKELLTMLPKDWSCRREAYDGDGKCIFHSARKNPNEFREALDKELKRMDEHETIYDYIGFVFPEKTVLSEMSDIRTFTKTTLFIGATFERDVFFECAQFEKGVYFIGAIFKGLVNFYGARFSSQTKFDGASFGGITFFSWAEFIENVSFNKTKFLKHALFRFAVFNKQADFTDSQFQDYVDFDYAKFSNTLFEAAHFQKTTSFFNAEFNGEVNFNTSQFKGETTFREAVFHKPVKLEKIIFHGTVIFDNIKFCDFVSFAFATFKENARFENTKFEQDVIFLKAIFSKKGYFIEAKFQKEAAFDDSSFSGDLHFRRASFHKASFIGVVFKEIADFANARFMGPAYFYISKFQGETNFKETEFFHIAGFSKAKFEKNVYFIEAKFFKTAWFNNALFQGMAEFGGSEFHESVSFMDCQFNSLAIFTFSVFYKEAFFKTSESSSGYLIFLASYFQSPKNVQIIGYSFSRVSFVLTDIEGVIWIPMRREDKYILDDKLLRLLEGKYPRDLLTDNPDITLKLVSILNPYINRESVIQEYKRIRKCLESNKMFTEAADLFIREMELARKFLSWRRNFFEKIAHFLYDIFSRYGESINRPVLFVLGVNFLAPILLLLLFPPLDSFDTAISRLSEYPKYFQAVLAVFMQIKSFADPELGLKNIPLIIEILIRIFAIIIFGNLFVAVRRRLERR